MTVPKRKTPAPRRGRPLQASTPYDVNLNVRLPADLADALRALAVKRMTKPSELVRQAIRALLAGG